MSGSIIHVLEVQLKDVVDEPDAGFERRRGIQMMSRCVARHTIVGDTQRQCPFVTRAGGSRRETHLCLGLSIQDAVETSVWKREDSRSPEARCRQREKCGLAFHSKLQEELLHPKEKVLVGREGCENRASGMCYL